MTRDSIPSWQAVALIVVLWPLWVLVLLWVWLEEVASGWTGEDE